MRKSKRPSSEKDNALAPIDQTNFGVMVADQPASTIGDNVALIVNAHSYGERIEGKTGSRQYERLPTTFPKYPGYTSFRAYQVNNKVYRVSGAAFTASLLGKWMVWPGTPPTRIEIVEIISGDEMIVAKKGVFGEQGGCYIQGRVRVKYQHKMNKKFFLHIDTRLFTCSFGDTSWTDIFQMGYWGLADSKTFVYEFDDYLILINANGQFKANINTAHPYFFKMNSPPPTTLITDVPGAKETVYKRRYIYSNIRLIGNSSWRYVKTVTRDTDRTDIADADGSTFIESETGTTAFNNDKKDYGEVSTGNLYEFPIGPATGAMGQLTCLAMTAGTDDNVLLWRAIDDGSFRITINGNANNVMCDFTTAETIEDVAYIVQSAIRALGAEFAGVTVTIDPAGGTPNFVIRTAPVQGSTIAVLAATVPAMGTDISGAGAVPNLKGSGGAAAANARWDWPLNIGTLTLALPDEMTTGDGEYHHNYYAIYGTKDVGKRGIELGNKPDAYTWVADVPVAKSYYGSVDNFGNLTITQGTLSYYDGGNVYNNGCTLEFEDGTRVTIVNVTTANTGTVFGGANIAAQPCAIGNDANSAAFGVFSASQVGHRMTIQTGYNLIATDRGKPVFFADGRIGYVRTVISGTEADMLDSLTFATQAACINPTSREFTDRITDDTLEDRFHFDPFTPDHRFWRELPNCNLGVVVPGFIAVANTGENKYSYSPMGKESSMKYLGGSYNEARHYDDKPEDSITRLAKYPDKLIVQCSRSTWSCPTNIPMVEELKDYGIVLPILPNLTLVDDIGILHVDSVDTIGVGREIMITSEPAIRTFDGNSYSAENLADKQVMSYIKRISTKAIGFYNHAPEGGYVIEGTEVE